MASKLPGLSGQEVSRLTLKIVVIARQEAIVKKFSAILRFFTQFGFIVFTYLVRTFEKLGWRFARQSASHIILVKEGEMVTLSVPDHHEVAKGTLHGLIRTAGLTVEEFIANV